MGDEPIQSGVATVVSRHSMTRVLSAWLWLASAGYLMAADWPQWRGPNRDGVWTETGILKSFPSGGLKPKWKAPVGFGYSTPIVANGKVYVSDLTPEKPIAHERVLCFNARTGKQLWLTQHDTSPPDWFFGPELMRGPGPTPIIHNGRVYALSMFSVLRCFDAQ